MAGGNITLDQIDTPPTTAPINSTTVSDLFSAIDTATTQDAQSLAENYTAVGDTGEENAYTTAAAIANANSRLAAINGTIQQAQEALALRRTQGAATAGVAAGGFTVGGSALDILRGNNRQGLLEQQLTGSTAQLAAGGYAQQGEASVAEAAAAGTASQAASVLSASDLAVASQSKTNAINEAAAMGVTIPGLDDLSATSIPNANPVSVGQTVATPAVNPTTGISNPYGITIGPYGITGVGNPAGTNYSNQIQQELNASDPSVQPTSTTVQLPADVSPAGTQNVAGGIPQTATAVLPTGSDLNVPGATTGSSGGIPTPAASSTQTNNQQTGVAQLPTGYLNGI